MKSMKIKAQVWVETVIYTLIGLSVIGILLGFAVPRINESRDKAVIEQSISVLGGIDGKIYEVQGTKWNKRVVDLKISKGKLVIDGINNEIYWIMDSKSRFSEPGTEIPFGKTMRVLTEKKGDAWSVKLRLPYNIDLKTNGADSSIELLSAATPYSLNVENIGNNEGGTIIVDMSVS